MATATLEASLAEAAAPDVDPSVAKFFRLPSMASLRDVFDAKVPADLTLSIVVLGASGDLAKKKTFPALFALYSKG